MNILENYIQCLNESDDDVQVLMDFLNLPLNTTKEVFEKFGGNDGDYHYIEGRKDNKVLLVAHADTVWKHRDIVDVKSKLIYSNCVIDNGAVVSKNPQTGIGADDRAGCAILHILRNSGHSLLILNDEEIGCVGAKKLSRNKELFDEIQKKHQFMIEVDRCDANDFKCYDVGTPEFRKWLSTNTPYKDAGYGAFSDISFLGKDICGVNFSVGYYNEHTPREKVVIAEWKRTLDFLRGLLQKDLPRFELMPLKDNNADFDWMSDDGDVYYELDDRYCKNVGNSIWLTPYKENAKNEDKKYIIEPTDYYLLFDIDRIKRWAKIVASALGDDVDKAVFRKYSSYAYNPTKDIVDRMKEDDEYEFQGYSYGEDIFIFNRDDIKNA
jgi:hypothetical protein